MKVTIKDVADAAGVSKATVSKVINESYSISEKTAEKVNAVIRELGYTPNRRAQNFATRQTKNIFFFAEMKQGIGFENPHLFEILAGAEHALFRKGYGLVVRHITAADLSRNFESILCDEYMDGAILHASVVTKFVADLLEKSHLPYIVVGMPSFPNQICWIDTNNSVAGRIAAEHLINQGYRRIAFIGGTKEDMISAHRLEGVETALGGEILPEYLFETNPGGNNVGDVVDAMCQCPVLPNAIICANQYIAFGCVRKLLDKGVKIPEEMAIITFDDFPFSRVLEPQLTVVNLDMYDMGEQAAKIVLRRIRKPQLVVQSQTTLPILIQRESTVK